jgi:hypothetical protein
LKAALRHEDDVLALLQPAKSSPATKTTPAVAVELHA